MFKEIKEAFKVLLSLLQHECSYTVMVIPSNGGEMKEKTVGTPHFRKIAYTLGAIAVFFVGSLGVMYYAVVQSNAEAAELEEFRVNRQAQEEKLKELNVMAENVQKDIAALSKIEEQVREQMQKSGMEVPAPSTAKE